jgi:hypothetical protein
MFWVLFFNINGIVHCESTRVHISSTLCTRRYAMKVSREMVHSKLVFLASDTFSVSVQSQTLFALPKSKPFQLFSVVSKFLHKGNVFAYLMAFQIKLMTVLAAFKAQDFKRVSCSGKLALLTVSSCKATDLKRAAWNNC